VLGVYWNLTGPHNNILRSLFLDE